MTIEFLTQDDPLYILPFFEEFFRHYATEFKIQRVMVCRAMGKRSRKQLLKELLYLYRPLGFARLCTRLVAAKLLSRQSKNRYANRFYSLEQLCAAYGVECERVANPNSPDTIAALKQRAPEVLVSVACPFILKDAVLQVPPRGCVNIHHAPLPRYKGMMPTFWQLLHGENRVGVTVHYMVPKIDEGAALLQESLEVEPGETLDELIRRSKRHGAHCMATALREIAAGTAVPKPLNQSAGSYFTFPTLAEMKQFHRKGLRAI